MKTAHLMTKREKTWFCFQRPRFPQTDGRHRPRLSELQSHGWTSHPLGAVVLGAKRKSKRCEVCVQKRGPTHPDVDLRLSCVSANTLFIFIPWLAREGSHHRFWYTLFWACPWIDLQGAPSKLRRAKYAVKHLSTLAGGRNAGLGTASPHSK